MTGTIRIEDERDEGDPYEGVPSVAQLAVVRGDGATEPEYDAWAPVDLGPYLRGEVVRPEPAVGLFRSDRQQLLYPGKEHAIIGEMEAGKSWLALMCSMAELDAGHHVIYVHFEESDPSDTVDRLLDMGALPEILQSRFHFIGPDRPASLAHIERLIERHPRLVVLDGINEGMALHRCATNDAEGVAEFRRRITKPFVRTGAATLSLDHVTKDRETRGRYAMGSIHKGNALSGALILLETADAFSRGQRGRSHVFVTKDRPGHLRQAGRPDRDSPGKTYLGELVVDDTREFHPYLDVAFYAPSGEVEAPRGNALDLAVLEGVKAIIVAGHVPNMTNVKATVKGKGVAIAEAVERLLIQDLIVERPGPRGARVFDLPPTRSHPFPPVPERGTDDSFPDPLPVGKGTEGTGRPHLQDPPTPNPAGNESTDHGNEQDDR